MKTLKMFALISAVALAATFTACVTKDNTPPPPEAPKPATATPTPVEKPTETPKPTATATPTTAGDELAAKGKVIFEGAGACAGCHGKDGGTGIPTATKLNDAAWQGKTKDDEISAVLKGSKADKGMPKYSGAETDIPALVAYVRQLGGKKPAGK